MFILDNERRSLGLFQVKLLPTTNPDATPPPLVDLRADPERDTSLEPVQLLEGEEYLYEIELDITPTENITTDKPELFQPDTAKGDRGRLRPGLYVGGLPVTILIGQTRLSPSLSMDVKRHCGRPFGSCNATFRACRATFCD